MYSIRYGNALIYDPRLPEYRILQGKLNRAVNKAGSLVFSLPAGHPGYGTPKRLKGNVSVFDDEEEIFRGRVLDDQDELNRNRRYTCEGCLAFLNDSTVRPYSWQGSVPGYLGFLLDQHNEQVEAERKIYLGVVTVTDPNDYIIKASDQYPTTWKEIEEKLLKNKALQGYLIPRIQGGRIYVDYLSEITAFNDQEARFGSNLLDLSWLRKGQDIATVIVPVGHKDETTETRLTIKEVNAGKDYLEDQEAIEKYGRITKTVFYDDVTLASNLLRKGREDLAKGVESAEMIQIKAADLAKAGYDISTFRFAEMIRVKSGLHGLETEMLVSSMATDLLHPEQSTLALGALSSSFTSSQADTWKKKDEELNAEISNREAAQRDLAERIANSSGMFITTEQQPDGSVIYYAHNKRRIDESDIVLKFTMEAFAISTDGGETYPYGMDVSGTAILNRIYTVGLDAGHINTGSLVGRDSAGNVVFSFNAETGEIWIKSSQIDVSGSQSLDDALSALDTKAGNAQAAAGVAQSTANSAVSAAAAAQSTATGAASTANSANQTASAANQTAGEALQAARDAETNAKALVVTLSRDSFIIPTDSEGSGGDYSGCTAVLSVQWGNEDVTADADIAISDGTGALMANSKKLLVNGRYLKLCTGDITSSWNPSTFTYTVTECRAEIAAATFTVSYNGKTMTKKLNIIKAMQGLQGIQGEHGMDGINGVSIISVDVWYAVSTSSTVAPVSGWSTNQPAWEDGQFIWFKTVTAYSTGSTTESMPACITGSAGYQGETGVGIDLIEEEYYLSTSDTEQVGGSWSSTATWETGKYLWQRLKITYDNDIHTVKYTEPTLAQAINDANQRASDTEEEVHNLEVGTVNLIRVANTLLFDQYYFIGGLLVNGKLLKVNGKHLVTRVAP